MNFFRQNSEAVNPPPDPIPAHPYSPQYLTIAGYVSNNKSAMELLVSFAAVWIPIFAAVWTMASVYGRSLKPADKVIMMWFTLCRIGSDIEHRRHQLTISQADVSMSSSRDISSSTIGRLVPGRISLHSCGRNTPCRIRDTLRPIPLCSPLRP